MKEIQVLGSRMVIVMPNQFEKKPTPRGFNCTTCGEFHVFSAYVYAHAHNVLTHTCGQCGANHEVLNFRAVQITPGASAA